MVTAPWRQILTTYHTTRFEGISIEAFVIDEERKDMQIGNSIRTVITSCICKQDGIKNDCLLLFTNNTVKHKSHNTTYYER